MKLPLQNVLARHSETGAIGSTTNVKPESIDVKINCQDI
jgi:hypothetical protein